MGTITTMIIESTGPAHPDDVWRRFSTPAMWPEWAPQIRAVSSERADRLAVGSTGRVHGPAGIAVDYEITELDDDLRSWAWTVGRGPARVRMEHHVLPAPVGGSRASVRIEGAAAVLGQPYRLVAGIALRRLVRSAPSGPPLPDAEPVTVFDFAFDPAYAAAALPFGITAATTSVEVGPRWLAVRYGPWRLLTPRSNVVSTSLTGDFAFAKTAGPPHLSFTDRGVSFTTNGRRALCVQFAEPVAGIDTTGTIRHPGATLTVTDPEGLAAALEPLSP